MSRLRINDLPVAWRAALTPIDANKDGHITVTEAATPLAPSKQYIRQGVLAAFVLPKSQLRDNAVLHAGYALLLERRFSEIPAELFCNAAFVAQLKKTLLREPHLTVGITLPSSIQAIDPNFFTDLVDPFKRYPADVRKALAANRWFNSPSADMRDVVVIFDGMGDDENQSLAFGNDYVRELVKCNRVMIYHVANLTHVNQALADIKPLAKGVGISFNAHGDIMEISLSENESLSLGDIARMDLSHFKDDMFVLLLNCLSGAGGRFVPNPANSFRLLKPYARIWSATEIVGDPKVDVTTGGDVRGVTFECLDTDNADCVYVPRM